MPLDWALINTIQYRVDHPEQIPGNSWYTVYREDIYILLREVRKLEEELQKVTQDHKNPITGKFL